MNAYFIRFPEYRGGVKFKPIDEFPGYWIGEDGTVVSTRRGDPCVEGGLQCRRVRKGAVIQPFREVQLLCSPPCS